MAKRGWSLTDAQLERRKQNPAARSAQAPGPRSKKPASLPTAPFTQPVGKRAMPKPRPSPARIAERSGLGRGVYSNRDYYNTATYSLPDVASLGRGISQTRRGDVQPAYKPTARGGSGNYDDPTVPTRSMAGGRPRIDGGSDAVDNSKRRQASTQAAYRAADASMFNSNVTPKAERVENKRPRSRMSPDQNVFW